jgi:peptide chain release factor subunit 1
MLDRNELKEIAEMRDEDACYVSLFLNVNPLTNPRGEYAIQFKNMLRGTLETLDKGIYRTVKEDLKRVESAVLGNKRLFKKGLAILSCTRHSFWREYHLSVPLKSELIIEKSPCIRPLLDILDHYQRYAALLVDKESARIFVVHLGEIAEYREVHTPDIPGKHKKGGWFALTQSHYERHIEYHVGLHLKEVVKQIDAFISGEKISGLIIGGSGEAVSRVREMLPATIHHRIVGTFHAEMFGKNDEILSKIEPVIIRHEKEQREESAERLIRQAMKNENAVLGMENVLNALQEGRVMKLLFLRDLSPVGFVCENCGSLGVQDIKQCPYCKGDMKKANYLVELAVQKAVEQGAAVEVVIEHKGLADAGGIGAFVRF